jgi:hypothetical protein
MKRLTCCLLPCKCEFDMEFQFINDMPDDGTIVNVLHLCEAHLDVDLIKGANKALLDNRLMNNPDWQDPESVNDNEL